MESLTKDYGLYGLLIYVAIKEIWPFFRDKLFPEKIRFQQEQEARFTTAIEGIKNAVSIIAEASTIQNERLANLTNITEAHNSFTNDAVTAMLVKTGTIPKRKATIKKK